MGKNISTITNIMLSVSWLEVLSHNVITSELTLTAYHGNNVMPAVKITPNCTSDATKILLTKHRR
ncbi:hypothetical protein DJICPGNB_02710 [Escherichia coli]|nr:hypothetical protein DJICPGNB_02710 [Escherichia coli]